MIRRRRALRAFTGWRWLTAPIRVSVVSEAKHGGGRGVGGAAIIWGAPAARWVGDIYRGVADERPGPTATVGRGCADGETENNGIDLAALIDEARSEAFVGRTAELASFDAASSEASLRRVLFVHGPGGIGKTTLLHQFRLRAGLAGRAGVRGCPGCRLSPEGLRAALGGTGAIVDQVVLIDGYEQLDPIDGGCGTPCCRAWARGRWWCSPVGMRHRALAVRPGARAVVAVHRLDKLDAADSVELLARAGVAGSVPATWRRSAAATR